MVITPELNMYTYFVASLLIVLKIIRFYCKPERPILKLMKKGNILEIIMGRPILNRSQKNS